MYDYVAMPAIQVVETIVCENILPQESVA